MRGVAAIFMVVLTLCSGGAAAGGGGTGASRAYRNAYYLFAIGPLAEGVDRTIPMLLTPEAIETATAAGKGCVLLWTYERDSLSGVREGVRIGPEDLKPQERHVRVPALGEGSAARWYRYQRVALSEARHLLEHPEGSIPVHRAGVSRELLDALRSSLEGE
jgi:hypothetical protein